MTHTRPISSIETKQAVGIDEIWRESGPSVLRFATVLVGPADAHDVMVDAFLRIAHGVGWDHADEPQSYWFRGVQSEAQNRSRSRKRRWQRDLVAVPPAWTDDDRRDLDLIELIAQLSVQQRSVVYLAYWEDMTESSIAITLGVSTGTVHRTLSRARTHLRKALS